MKRDKKTAVITIYIVLFAIVFIAVVARVLLNHNSIAKSIDTIKDINIIDVEPNSCISFSDFGEDDFTCTGMAFDSSKHCYWLADCGLEKGDEKHMPRLIKVEEDFSSVTEIVDLSNVVDSEDNLQGVAFDSKNESLWIAIGSAIEEIDYHGNLKRRISLGRYKKYQANGICYDEKDDTLWVLCYTKYILHYDKNGNLISTFNFHYFDQDQIAIHNNELIITIGADYRGLNNYVCVVSKGDGAVLRLYRVKKTYAEEGICFNRDKLMIANDGYYHDAIINESYIAVFDSSIFLK